MRAGTVATVLAVVAATVGACGGTTSDSDAARGAHVEVLAVWRDAEQARFGLVLDRFEKESGVSVRYTSTAGEDMGRVLDARIAAGRPPDVAVLPQPALIPRYARAGAILPIDDLEGAAVRRRYSPVWQRLGSFDGRLYAVWFKAANKSLIWYDVGAFERAGVVPPADLDGLLAVERALTAAGITPFAVAGRDAWTLTDWFENVYLRVAGPARYDALAAHRLPWTDSTVRETLRWLARILDPRYVAGGAQGALATTFPESVTAAFSRAPRAAMVFEGDFVAGVITGSTHAQLGIDADAFPFPDLGTPRRLVVGGGDALVLMRPTPGGRALLRYLATPRAAEVWARLGGFISPNEDVGLQTYGDPMTRAIARGVLEAGDGFRFDLSDLQPPEFGGTTGAGMFAILQDFLSHPADVDATAARLEAAATAAHAGVSEP